MSDDAQEERNADDPSIFADTDPGDEAEDSALPEADEAEEQLGTIDAPQNPEG